jgi:hypothetical protein
LKAHLEGSINTWDTQEMRSRERMEPVLRFAHDYHP